MASKNVAFGDFADGFIQTKQAVAMGQGKKLRRTASGWNGVGQNAIAIL